MIVVLPSATSSSPRQWHSFEFVHLYEYGWLLCCISIPSGRDSCHDLLCFSQFLPRILGWLLHLFHCFYPSHPRPHPNWLLCGLRDFCCALVASILPFGGDKPPRTIIRPLVAGPGGDRDHCGGWIRAANSRAGRGGIGDGVGGVWWWLGGYLEAAGHGRGSRCVVCSGENGEKRALRAKKINGRI